ncbi:hypothetical protein AAHA92_24505 [Salvia divinorum]|uniref:Uncharacterized protein n=1 Tax=Salvia divinorum TaxID=28513 RepID=A0ABD1GA84_SALDI
MSIINITLFVLFLSLHSCNARVIAVAHNHHPAKDFVKGNDEKMNRYSNLGEKDSVSKRSFRVAQRKRGEDEEAGGFNLDYLPPRTHPPSHN